MFYIKLLTYIKLYKNQTPTRTENKIKQKSKSPEKVKERFELL